jgi:hypothetical protein
MITDYHIGKIIINFSVSTCGKIDYYFSDIINFSVSTCGKIDLLG